MRPQEHRRALTSEERKFFVQVGLEDRRFYLFMLMLFCGCRPSEASECMGKDIKHSEHPMLHIRGTKTALSDREVPIPDILYQKIKNTPKNEYIACTNTGHKISPYERRREWKYFTRCINMAMGAKTYRNALIPPLPLADDLEPYCLRHEYCTELARRGIDIRIAQKLMGHSTITLTANIYTNLQSSDLETVSAQLSDLA